MSSKSGQSEENSPRRPARQWSIARRLTALYVAATTVLLLLAAAYLYWSQVNNLAREDNDFLVNKIEDCRRLLQERPNDARLLVNEIQTEATASRIKYYVRLLDDQGTILMETPGMTNVLPLASFPAPTGITALPVRGTVLKTANNEACLTMSARAEMNQEGAVRGRVLQVALDVSEEEALIAGYRGKLAMVVLLGSLFSLIAGAFVTRKGLRPLKEITQATGRITASQLHERILADGWPLELTSLARSFDKMLDRLEDSFKRLSQFSADLAHELRTPVNNLRGGAGVALSQARTAQEYRRTLESSLEEYARLARLIDNLLFLARADGATANLKRVPCDARKAVEAVREYYEALAADRGVEISCQGEGTAHADPVLFRQAISNLLSNALNHTPSGGRVSVCVAERNGGGLDVMVADTGPGIAPEHLPRIFDRLYRADTARSHNTEGAGLGLAIVKSIMTLHGGSVQVQSEPGKGARFRLLFPRHPVQVASNLTEM